MKNVILAMLGIAICFYTITIGFSVFSTQTRKNELETSVARIVESTLEENYKEVEEEAILASMIEEITQALGGKEDVTVQVQQMDLQKGIISVRVEESFRQFNGQTKTLSCEKTVIVEREVVEDARVVVQFWVEDELYKEYQLTKGEVCPMPKLPAGYTGWKARDTAAQVSIEQIKEVWEDKVYEAILE